MFSVPNARKNLPTLRFPRMIVIPFFVATSLLAGLLVFSPPSFGAADEPPSDFTATRNNLALEDALVWTDRSTTERHWLVEVQEHYGDKWKVIREIRDHRFPPSETGKKMGARIVNAPEGRFHCYRVSAVTTSAKLTSNVACGNLLRPHRAPELNLLTTRDIDAEIWHDPPQWDWAYRVYIKRPGGTWQLFTTVRASSNSTYTGANYDELIPDRYYCFRLTSWSPEGESAPSNELCGRTKKPRPVEPTDFGPVTISERSIRIGWTDVSTTEKEVILYYKEYGSSHSQEARRWGPIDGGFVSHKVTGLKPDTRYEFVLFQRGDDTPDSWTTTDVIRTKKPAPPPPTDEIVEKDYIIRPYVPWEGTIFWKLLWNEPGGVHMTSMKFLNTYDRTMVLMKHGELLSRCGYPDASIAVEAGQAITSAQLKWLYGTSNPNPPLLIEACHVGHNNQIVPVRDFTLRITYVKPAG